MNVAVIMGRFTRNPELKNAGETSVTKFSVAVDRPMRNGKKEADFINCTAFGKTAENISKFFVKGKQILINGRIQTGSYVNQKGDKVYTTDVIVNTFDFIGSKSDSTSDSTLSDGSGIPDGFEPIDDESNLPF